MTAHSSHLVKIYVKIDPMQYIMKGSAWVMDKSLEVVAKPLSKISAPFTSQFTHLKS